jgi:hypothetical protein
MILHIGIHCLVVCHPVPGTQDIHNFAVGRKQPGTPNEESGLNPMDRKLIIDPSINYIHPLGLLPFACAYKIISFYKKGRPSTCSQFSCLVIRVSHNYRFLSKSPHTVGLIHNWHIGFHRLKISTGSSPSRFNAVLACKGEAYLDKILWRIFKYIYLPSLCLDQIRPEMWL